MKKEGKREKRTVFEELLDVNPRHVQRFLTGYKKFEKKQMNEFKKEGTEIPKDINKNFLRAQILMNFISVQKERKTKPKKKIKVKKDFHLIHLSKDMSVKYTFATHIGRCINAAVVFKVLAQHLGIHSKKKGTICKVAISEKIEHGYVHFYIKGEKCFHIIDPVSITVDGKPENRWNENYEPATELTDRQVVDWFKSHKAPAEKAIKILEKMPEKFKNNVNYLERIGNLLISIKRVKEGKQYMQRANAIYERPSNLIGKALSIYAQQGEREKKDKEALKKALRYIEKAIRKIEKKGDKRYLLALHTKASIQAEIGRFRRAKNTIKKALKIEPTDDMLWCAQGEIYFKEERYDDALKSFDKSIEINPENVRALHGRALSLKNKPDIRAIAAFDMYVDVRDKQK